jgi:hypothetical protein
MEMIGNLHEFNAPPPPGNNEPKVSGDLTLRDYFAIRALKELFVYEEQGFSELEISKWAYDYANAMMEARK